MKFQVNRDVFSEAVSFAVKLLPQRTTLPILAGVLIEATDDGLSLSSFDYEVSARTTIAATGRGAGHESWSPAACSPTSPAACRTLRSSSSTRTAASPSPAAPRDFTLLSMPVEEYPTLPEVSATSPGLVPAEDFATAIAQVAVAASRDDVTPVITGVQLEVTGIHHLARRHRPLPRRRARDPLGRRRAPGSTEATALVPARTLSEVGKTFGHGGTISVAITSSGDRELIAFSADHKTVTSLLIKGNFPPVRRLFPETAEHYAVVNTAELIEAVRRVALVLEREAALRFTLHDRGRHARGHRLRAGPGVRVDRRAPHRRPTRSSRSSRSSCSTGSVRCKRSSCGSRSRRPTTPTSPGPVLITSQSSKDQPGADNFKYLLQPNLLLR